MDRITRAARDDLRSFQQSQDLSLDLVRFLPDHGFSAGAFAGLALTSFSTETLLSPKQYWLPERQ